MMTHEKKGILLAILLILSLSSCYSGKRESYETVLLDGKERLLHKVYNEKGDVFLEEQMTLDSVKEGVSRSWEKGKLVLISNYESGQKSGPSFVIEKNGDTIKKENWFVGKRFGEQIEYSNASSIKKYSFYNVVGDKLFEVFYNLDGNVDKAIGSPLYCAYSRDRFPQKDTFSLMYYFGIPKNLKWDFSVVEMNEGGDVLLEQHFDRSNADKLMLLDFAKKYGVDKVYSNRGNYKWTASLLIRREDGSVLVSDSSVLNVSVF